MASKTNANDSANYGATPSGQLKVSSNPLSDAEVNKYTDPANLPVDPNYPLPQQGTGYHPGRKESNIRMQLYRRYYEMRDNDWRTEAERQWEMADKEYMLWLNTSAEYMTTTQDGQTTYPIGYNSASIPDPDTTLSNMKLPDSFSAIQSHMQEIINRKSRPALSGTNASDEPVQEFANAVMNYNMNNTDFDYNWFMGGLAAAIRGTAFYFDYYRFEQRWVRDPDDVDEQGNLTYKTRLITDFDDDYTQWIPNEYAYVDEMARHINEAKDCVWREIMNIRDFQQKYGKKKDFINVEYVKRGGETTTRAFFKLPKDITGNDVEVLHYYNKMLDVYWVAANWVVVHIGPLPWKHKELPFAVRYYYRVPGRFWGLGIPHVIHMLAEERNSIRNLNMDRQNLQINKMFLHNNAFDITDEDLVSRPHGLVSVDTNGLPLDQVIKPIEYGDVPASYFKTDQIMLDDISRAIGIDLTKEEAPSTTATAAALHNENYLKRINMIAALDEQDTIVRIGRLKWSNIQFFYPLGRMDKIYDSREEKEEQVFKTINVHGQKFQLVDENGEPTLKMENVTGASSFNLDKKMAKYLEGSFDITINYSEYTPTSKAVQQTKITELFSLLIGNPQILSLVDLGKAVARVLSINDEQPSDWLAGLDQDPGHTMLQAEKENQVMAAGQPLGPTPGATSEHTLVHIMYTRSRDYDAAVQRNPVIRQIFMEHIMGEHEANPSTGPAAETLSANGLGGTTPGQPGNPNMQKPTPPGEIGALPNLPSLGLTPNVANQPMAQAADIQPTNLSKPMRTAA